MSAKNDTSERILDAAIALMTKKGYNPVTIREIAKAVGLSEMTVFRHFPSKYAMLMAAMRRASYTAIIEEVFTTHVRWELEHDLRCIMRRYLDVADQRMATLRIYFSALGQLDEHSTELVSDVTLLFWNQIFGFVAMLVLGRKRAALDRDLYIENTVSMLINGIAQEDEACR